MVKIRARYTMAFTALLSIACTQEMAVQNAFQPTNAPQASVAPIQEQQTTELQATPAPTTAPVTITATNRRARLTIRNRTGQPDNYITSTYSFYHLTRDNIKLTRNYWDIEARRGETAGSDEFNTIMTVADKAVIADLGKGACENKTIAAENLQKVTAARATIKVGHCYVVAKSNPLTSVIATFHVKSHTPGKSVFIDTIVVLERNLTASQLKVVRNF